MNPPLISVIIAARREAKTIAVVIKEAKKIFSRLEVIVVCNGSDPLTVNRAKQAGARVIQFGAALGHDVGRLVGAHHAKGQILLFLDADFVIPASILRRFCYEVWKGYDVVLNAYSGLTTSRFIHPTSQAKRLLNYCLGCPELKGASMTTVPHALSKRAFEQIGEHVMVPPKALATAILKRLNVTCAHAVNVSKMNKKRKWSVRKELERVILGDHAEALALLLDVHPLRGTFTDFRRKREMIHDQATCTRIEGKTYRKAEGSNVSFIISAHNEAETIWQLLSEIKKLNPFEIIVVENGSTDGTLELCKKQEVTLITFPTFIGHDVGRAIGAREAKGDILVFLDADIVFTKEQVQPFIDACSGKIDIVLNNINPYLRSSKMIDYVSMAKYFLNRMLGLSFLRYSSLTTVPHAIKKSVLEHIEYEQLAVPPKAQALAALKGLRIDHVQGVNVIRSNKKRKYNVKTLNVVQEMIVGDHLEAIHVVQQEIGLRGFLYDTVRKREVATRSRIPLAADVQDTPSS